jgi:SET domain-containing protein
VENSRSLLRADLEKEYSFQYIDALDFISSDLLSKIQKRCEKKLKYRRHASNNRWTVALLGEEIAQKKEALVEIKKVHPLVGSGVFAKERIPPLSMVGEYVGLVRKREPKKDRDNPYVFRYMIGPHEASYVIDAQNKGNFTRFINHSYEPNLISKWAIFEGIGRIVFCARRTIWPGEQLTVDYGPYYWRRRPHPLDL